MPHSRRGERTRETILQAASRRFRERGLAASSVGEIMRDAGLTHGGFYLHFDSKAELEAEAFSTATRGNRRRWFAGLKQTEPEHRVERLMRRYLSPAHRDGPAEGCPFASLGGEIAAAGSDELRDAYEQELKRSAAGVAENVGDRTRTERMDRALGLLAVCIGGLMMARAVRSRRLSDRILRACRNFALESAAAEKTTPDPKETSDDER